MYKAVMSAENKQHFYIALFVFAISFYGISQILFHGQEHSFGISREIPLGLLLLGYAFFVGTSVGLSIIATLSHVFGFEAYHLRSRHIALLSFATLIGAFFLLFWELGGPFHLQIIRFVTNYFSFEVTSPIWWMATFYMIKTPLIFLEFFLLIKGDKRSIFWAGVFGFIIGMLAYSTLSMVLAVNSAKPLWHTSEFTVSFVFGALICGGGAVLLLMLSRTHEEPIRENSVVYISKMIFFTLLATIGIHVWTAIVSIYGRGNLLSESIKVIIAGPLSFNYYFFEILIGVLIPLVLIVFGKFKSLPMSALASAFAIIGVFFNRYDGIVGGQIIKVESVFLPTLEYGSYSPTFAEISILIGGAGLAMVIYELGRIFLPMREVH